MAMLPEVIAYLRAAAERVQKTARENPLSAAEDGSLLGDAFLLSQHILAGRYVAECDHDDIYYSTESQNYYCGKCKHGMGSAFFKVARALNQALSDMQMAASEIEDSNNAIMEMSIKRDAAIREKAEANRLVGDYMARLQMAEKELATAREQLALCAENTTAADLAQEVELLKAELASIREVNP